MEGGDLPELKGASVASALSLDTVKSNSESGPSGIATSKECPRVGYVQLKTKVGAVVTVKVTCKTWRCKGCRNRTLNRVKDKIASGISMQGRCWFITLTYRMGEGRQRDAKSVGRDWARLLLVLSKSSPKGQRKAIYPDLNWFRVIEVTKKGQPHLHLIVGGIPGSRKEIGEVFRREWLKITQDSYIIKVLEVVGAAGAASYLTKYMVKGMVVREQLEALGFDRRWSRSRNWPAAPIELRGTVEDRWYRGVYISGKSAGVQAVAEAAKDDEGHYLLERLGPESVLELERRKVRKGKLKFIRGFLNANNRTKDVSDKRGGGYG